MKAIFLVTLLVLTTVTVSLGAVARKACPIGKAFTNCDIDPCEREKSLGCPLHRTATCVSDYCGGCYDTWWLHEKQVWCWAGKF